MDKVPLCLRALCALALACATSSLPAAGPEDKSTSPPNTIDGAELVQALSGGGYVIYFRHGKTDLSTRDADRADLANCATQRKLSEEGRREMAEIGKLFVQMRIPVGTVLASPYCRAIDTAKLAFGKVAIDRELEHTVTADAATTRQRGQALARLLGSAPAAKTNTVLAGHTGNLQEAVGIWPSPEGVAIVFKPERGTGRYVATVPPTRWAELARFAAGPGAGAMK